jgi:hypothetical protein
MAIAIFGFYSAFRFGAATLDYYFVRNTIELWQTSAQQQSEQAYLAAKTAVNTAEILHSSHPLYADLSGQVTEWGVVAQYESVEALNQAEADYLRAVSLRPAWPVTWASLAMIKWRKQEFDDVMLRYLSNADRLGQQKPEVHVLFVELGLALYRNNHPFYKHIREQTQVRLVKGLRNPKTRPRILQIIASNDAMAFACIWSESRDSHVYTNILKCDG